MPKTTRQYFRRRNQQALTAAKNLDDCIDSMIEICQRSPTAEDFSTVLGALKESHTVSIKFLILLEKTF